MLESKQEVTKVISLVTNGRKGATLKGKNLLPERAPLRREADTSS